MPSVHLPVSRLSVAFFLFSSSHSYARQNRKGVFENSLYLTNHHLPLPPILTHGTVAKVYSKVPCTLLNQALSSTPSHSYTWHIQKYVAIPRIVSLLARRVSWRQVPRVLNQPLSSSPLLPILTYGTVAKVYAKVPCT